MNNPMLTINNGKLCAGDRPIHLRGVNFGGWLMMEGYILGGRNIPEKRFKKLLNSHIGSHASEKFIWEFRDAFIQESDVKNVADMKFNVVRIPVHYKFFLEKNGWKYFDAVLALLEKYRIYCILDMHAVPGCQNSDWHCDSDGKVSFFDHKQHQNLLLRIWKEIAQRYKERSIIAAYDVMNEPVTHQNRLLNKIYQDLIGAIRATGDQHVIIVEGNHWALDLNCIDPIQDPYIMYSIHYYRPIETTFNLVSNQMYPGIINGEKWDKKRLASELAIYYNFGKTRKAPILVGEFGASVKCACCKQELHWIKDVVSIFEQFGFHWTYWTYKATGVPLLPNGLYQVFDNEWIRRIGPVFGWEKFPLLLKKGKAHKEQLLAALKTQNFIPNKDILHILTHTK